MKAENNSEKIMMTQYDYSNGTVSSRLSESEFGDRAFGADMTKSAIGTILNTTVQTMCGDLENVPCTNSARMSFLAAVRYNDAIRFAVRSNLHENILQALSVASSQLIVDLAYIPSIYEYEKDKYRFEEIEPIVDGESPSYYTTPHKDAVDAILEVMNRRSEEIVAHVFEKLYVPGNDYNDIVIDNIITQELCVISNMLQHIVYEYILRIMSTMREGTGEYSDPGLLTIGYNLVNYIIRCLSRSLGVIIRDFDTYMQNTMQTLPFVIAPDNDAALEDVWNCSKAVGVNPE